MTRTLVSLAVLAALGGCAIGQSDYSCKGLPDAVTCMTTGEAYEATRGSPYGINVMPGKPSAQTVEGGEESVDEPGVPLNQKVPKPYTVAAGPGVTVDLQNDMVPLRTPAIVMRIYILPWESEDGDLQVAKLIFSEVEERRWVIGTTGQSMPRTITPLNPPPAGTSAQAAAPTVTVPAKANMKSPKAGTVAQTAARGAAPITR